MIHRMREQFSGWRFDKKMRVFVSLSIIVATMVILIVSTVSNIVLAKQQSEIMAEEQLDYMASNLDSSLLLYKELLVAVAMDSGVQNYLGNKKSDADYFEEEAAAKNTLVNVNHMYSDMNFIALIKDAPDHYIYKGNMSVTTADFMNGYREDYNSSLSAGGALRINYSNVYLKNYSDKNTLNIYYPVYSTKKIGEQLGLLCVNINDNTLIQISGQGEDKLHSQLSLLDRKGNVIAAHDNAEIGVQAGYSGRLKGYKGGFMEKGSLCIYRKIGKWNYYIVNEIPSSQLAGKSIHTMMLLVVVILLMTGTVLVLTGKLITIAYRPLNSTVSKMEDVSRGCLDVRMDEEHLGEDFAKLANGFNHMMDEIDRLMEQVKLEQHQLEQIHLNALQSQIQPHFLYNTLECIHWQALSDGNQEVSTMVKALATYYRICLSRGKDIIALRQEIEHIKNYLIIQNMRYDNIINSRILVEENYLEVMIPKMTLQPLIENAIYHGIKVKEGKTGSVTIDAYREGEDVVVEVIDSGSGMTQKEIDEINSSISEYDENFGYGVRNVNKRIELVFGKPYGLHFEKNETGLTVKIRLPSRQGTAEWGYLEHV